ncbi:MAG: hypothetical protein ACJ76H_02480 [Bacteriovoracaceae bacterium]
MKWLVLLLIVACGHKEPPAQDVGDSDGDHVPNYLETNSALQKYVAEISPFTSIEGTLSFEVGQKSMQVQFNNNYDVSQNAMRLLTRSVPAILKEDYFSECSRLYPMATELPKNLDGIIHVSLSLTTKDSPSALFLTDGKSEYQLSAFAKNMDFRLSADELKKIFSGDMFFTLKKKEMENDWSRESNVRQRTYRVYFYDGTSSRIHYVSHALDFQDYLKLSGIHESNELKSVSGFTSDDQRVYWWTRRIGANDYALVKASMKEIASYNIHNFNKSVSIIDRTNGTSGKQLFVKKAATTRFAVKLRGTRAVNTFTETSAEERYQMNRCTYYTRTVLPGKVMAASKDDILSQIEFRWNDHAMNLDDFPYSVSEGFDLDGQYIEIAFERTPEEFTLSLPNLATSTFYPLGNYRISCQVPGPEARPTPIINGEGQMVLTVESFIEKID